MHTLENALTSVKHRHTGHVERFTFSRLSLITSVCFITLAVPVSWYKYTSVLVGAVVALVGKGGASNNIL